jgi:hypothetical protein
LLLNWRTINHRCWCPISASHYRQQNTGRKKTGRQKRSSSGQKVRRTASCHKTATGTTATTAANTQRSTFGTLKKNSHDHGQGQHYMNNKKNRLHGSNASNQKFRKTTGFHAWPLVAGLIPCPACEYQPVYC